MEPIYALTLAVAVGYGAAVTYLLLRSLRRNQQLADEAHVWWLRFDRVQNQVMHLRQQVERLSKQLMHTEKLLELSQKEGVA